MRSSLIPYRDTCDMCDACYAYKHLWSPKLQLRQNRAVTGVGVMMQKHSCHSLLKMGSTLSTAPGHTSATAQCVFSWQRSQPPTAPKTVSIAVIHNNKDFRETTKALHLSKLCLKGCMWSNCAIMNQILKEHGVKSPHEEYLISVTLTHITNSVQLLHLGPKIIHIIWGHASFLVTKST